MYPRDARIDDADAMRLVGHMPRVVANIAAMILVLNPVLHYLARTRGVFSESALSAALPLAACVMLGVYALFAPSRLPRNERPDRIVVLCLLAFWMTGLAQELAYGGEAGLRAIYSAIPLLVVPLLLGAIVGTGDAIRIVSRWVFWFAITLCVGSLVRPELLYVPSRETYTPLRAGWFANPNMYGAMAFHGLAAYSLIRYVPGRRAHGWSLVRDAMVVGVLAVCLGISGSRGSILGAAVTIGVMLVVTPTRERTGVQHALRLIGLASVGVVAIAIVADAVAAAHGSVLLQGLLAKQAAIDPSSGRLGLWTEMLSRWWRDAPLVGLGAGEATRVAEALGFSSSHNAFVRVLVQRGIVGGLLVGAIIARASHNAYRMTRQGYMPTLAVLAGLIAHSVFEDHLFSLGITVASVLFAQIILRSPVRAMSR